MPHLDETLGMLLGANLASTADQAIPITGASKFVIRRIVATNRSATPVLAAGGLYTAASKGGTIVVAAGQAFTALTSAAAALDLTLASGALGVAITASQLFFSLTTANGSAATCDLYIFGDPLS